MPGDDLLPEGIHPLGANPARVPFAFVDITSELQMHSLHTRQSASDCSACQRRLLPGETLHVYESGRSLCTLCAAREEAAPVKRERIRATTTRLAVVPRAA
jgi:hypothetical protein